MASCLLECLKAVHLEHYYPNFEANGITTSETLGLISMQDYPVLGIKSMEDRQRLYQLVEIVKDVQRHGKRCKESCRHRSGDFFFSSPMSPETSRKLKNPGYALIFDDVKKKLAMVHESSQTPTYRNTYETLDIPTSQYLQKTLFERSPPRSPKSSKNSTPNKHHKRNRHHSSSPKNSGKQNAEDIDHDAVESYLENIKTSPGPKFAHPHPRDPYVEKVKHNFGYNYGLPRSRVKLKMPVMDSLLPQERIKVCVRKRPVNKKEAKSGQIDIVVMTNDDAVLVNEPKLAIDLTKFTQQHEFIFDEVFDETCSNEDVYARTAQPLVECVFQRGSAVCFAYGQTGAGKTHTMMGSSKVPGLYILAARDIFKQIHSGHAGNGLTLWVSYFEIYLGQLFDLLHKRKKIHAREDGRSNVWIRGLTETKVKDASMLMKIIDVGNGVRMTGFTGVNADSSRSHAVLQLEVRDSEEKRVGKMSFIDLAGSERAADVKDFNNKQNRLEGAEINQSLLALKECIRSIDQATSHTPFRQSKLTHILKDSFSGHSRTCMIANIAPTNTASDNTLNTLRYADRVKELRKAPNSSVPRKSAPTSRKSTPAATSTHQNSSSTVTPSIFHPSTVLLSSTPNHTPKIKRQIASQKEAKPVYSAYESPIRGHGLRRKISDKPKSEPRRHKQTSPKRNLSAEFIMAESDEKERRSHKKDVPASADSGAFMVDKHNLQEEQPYPHDKPDLRADSIENLFNSVLYGEQGSPGRHGRDGYEADNENSELINHLDNIMERAKAVLNKSSSRDINHNVPGGGLTEEIHAIDKKTDDAKSPDNRRPKLKQHGQGKFQLENYAVWSPPRQPTKVQMDDKEQRDASIEAEDTASNVMLSHGNTDKSNTRKTVTDKSENFETTPRSASNSEKQSRSSIAQRIKNLPSPDEFLKSLAEARLQAKLKADLESKHPEKPGQFPDIESSSKTDTDMQTPSHQVSTSMANPALAQVLFAWSPNDQESSKRPFEDLLASPSNSRTSSAFKPYSNPNGASQDRNQSREGGMNSLNLTEKGEQRHSPDPSRCSVDDCRPENEVSDDPKKLISEVINLSDEGVDVAKPEEQSREQPATGASLVHSHSDSSTSNTESSVTTSTQASTLNSMSSPMCDTDAVNRQVHSNISEAENNHVDEETVSGNTNQNNALTSYQKSNRKDWEVNPQSDLPLRVPNRFSGDGGETTSASSVSQPPVSTYSNKISAMNPGFCKATSALKTEKLSHSGFGMHSTFSPIHPSPLTSTSFSGQIITKSILGDSLNKSGESPNDHSMHFARGKGSESDANPRSQEENSVSSTPGQSPYTVNAAKGPRRKGHSRTLSALQKAQNLLINSHEEALSDMTALCKQEMGLLLQVKSGHVSFEEYTKQLTELISSKTHCIETLSAQLQEINKVANGHIG